MRTCRAIQKTERANERAPDEKEQPPTKRQAVGKSHTPEPDEATTKARKAMAEKVQKAAAQVPKLLSQAGLPGVLEFVSQLDVDILIELVLSRMAYLPADSPPADATTQSCLDRQVSICRAHVAATNIKAEHTKTSSEPPAPVPSVPSSLAHSSGPLPKQGSVPKIEPAPAPARLPSPPPRPRPKLQVLLLPPAEMDALRGGTIRRILSAPRTFASVQRLRMVAKLAPAANTPEGQELLRGFTSLLGNDQEAALELVLSWLFALFRNQCCKLLDPDHTGVERELSDIEKSNSIDASHVYLSALESVFETLCRASHAEDRMPSNRLPPVTTLVTEVPLLPEGVVRRGLEFLCRLSPQWGKVALLTMRELIKSKHKLKHIMLQLAIEQLLRMRDPDLRSGTMRMLANQV
jgi:hypothetical protein